MQLTQKETMLISDLKNEEKLCIEKYTQHSSRASDPQLKNLFSQIATAEQGHLRSLEALESGNVPSPSGGGSSGSPSFTPYHQGNSEEMKGDMFLCSDVLAGEKHASSLYNTCVFEFKDEGARNLLNHIQKEEQEHGKQIYDYMSVNNMY